MRFAFAALLVLASSVTVLAQTTVPNTFTAGSPAKASEVNANFAALVAATNALTAKVIALEAQVASLGGGNGPLTVADVAGTYKVFTLSTATGSNASLSRFAAESGAADASLTLNLDGTFTSSQNTRSNAYQAKAQDCPSGAANTSPTNAGGTGAHVHQYNYSNCNQTAAPFASSTVNSLGVSGAGFWSLSAGNTITLSLGIAGPLTASFSKRSMVAFALDVATDSDPNNGPIRTFALTVLVKQ